MKWILVFLSLVAVPATAQTPAQDAALARVADALDQEFRLSYVAASLRFCNLRDPEWAGRVIMRARNDAGAVYEREMARLPDSQRRGFERDAFIMHAEYRARINAIMSRPTQTAVGCMDLRRNTAGLAMMDRFAH